jgi:PAS domain S-box-containing protein
MLTMTPPVRVLLVEDNPADARLVREELISAGSMILFQLVWVDTLEKGLEQLAAGGFQAVLIDLSLPDSQGLETLQRVIQYAPQIPVIVMTGLADEQIGTRAVQSGAQDYLIKGQVDGRLLVRVVQYAIQRKQTEMKLADALEFTERILTSAPIGIFTYTLSGECLSVNTRAAEMVGASVEQLLGQNFHHIESWKTSGLYDMALDAISTRQLIARDVYIVTTFNREAWYHAQFVLFKSGGEDLLLMIFEDITSRKQAEKTLESRNEEIRLMTQQLWQTAKLATMGELAASIAHELNNPLSTVGLRAEMLLEQLPADDPRERSLQIIDSEVRRMSGLVGNLLQYSRRGSHQVSTIDVCEELSNTLELIHYHLRTHNIQTVQQYAPDTPMAQVDRQQLRQVFLNLATNAVDAMPQGGILTLRTWAGEESAQPPVIPSRLPASASLGLPVSRLPQVFIEFSDTGEGIPAESMDRVWEPFYTSKAEGKGTGLGLAICRRIIQEHGGTIEIFSEGVPGKGTTVRIALPSLKSEGLFS